MIAAAKPSKQLSVRLHGKPIGVLTQNTFGRMEFSYLQGSDGAGHPLSCSMTSKEKTYDHHACEAYFGGLLPEGDAAQAIATLCRH